MQTVNVEQFKTVLNKGKTQAAGTFDGKKVKFSFDKLKMGFGWRHYFICPKCGQRRVTLAFDGALFACFKCANINVYAGIQTTTRGGYDFLSYKMLRFAKKNRVEGFKFPFDYRDYDRPPRRNRKQWDRAMLILQALESMRCQCIFFEKIWDAKTIQSVERGEHELLELPVMLHVMYWYSFDDKPIDTTKLPCKYTDTKG